MGDQVRADELASKYIALREFKGKVEAELKEKAGKIEAAMDKIETEMMSFLNTTGQESCRTKVGTFCKKTTTSARVANRDSFLHFVMENEATNFLTNHISADAVKEYVEEHKTVPPGVDITRVVKISVTRPNAR